MRKRTRQRGSDEASQAQADPTLEPLSTIPEDEEVVLAGIRGGRQLMHRLAEMGLLPGTRFRVTSQCSPGPVIINVKQMRLVLGQGMAGRVYVRKPKK